MLLLCNSMEACMFVCVSRLLPQGNSLPVVAPAAAYQAANDSTKQEVAAVQLQRQRLWHSLQELREGFIASCAQLDTQTHEVLHQLRATQSDGDLQGFSQDIDGLGDAHGSRLGAATAAAVGPGMLWPGLLAEDEPGAAEEEGPSSVLLCGGGLLLCEGEGSEQQQEDADMPEGMADAAPADGGLHMQS